MSLDVGRWKVSAEVGLVADSFTDEDRARMRMEIHQRVYRTPLAPGLPPISNDVVADRTAKGLLLGWVVTAASEADAWSEVLPMVSHVVFSHPKAKGWSDVSVRGVEVRLTQL